MSSGDPSCSSWFWGAPLWGKGSCLLSRGQFGALLRVWVPGPAASSPHDGLCFLLKRDCVPAFLPGLRMPRLLWFLGRPFLPQTSPFLWELAWTQEKGNSIPLNSRGAPMLLQGGLRASSRGGWGPAPPLPSGQGSLWAGAPWFPLSSPRQAGYSCVLYFQGLTSNAWERGCGVGSGGLIHSKRRKPGTSLGHTSALRCGRESGPRPEDLAGPHCSSQSRVTSGESLGCWNPGLRVHVLAPESYGWKGLTLRSSPFQAGTTGLVPPSHQEEAQWAVMPKH